MRKKWMALGLGVGMVLTNTINIVQAQTVPTIKAVNTQSQAEINLLNNMQKCLTKLNQERKNGTSSVNTAKEIMGHVKKADNMFKKGEIKETGRLLGLVRQLIDISHKYQSQSFKGREQAAVKEQLFRVLYDLDMAIEARGQKQVKTGIKPKNLTTEQIYMGIDWKDKNYEGRTASYGVHTIEWELEQEYIDRYIAPVEERCIASIKKFLEIYGKYDLNEHNYNTTMGIILGVENQLQNFGYTDKNKVQLLQCINQFEKIALKECTPFVLESLDHIQAMIADPSKVAKPKIITYTGEGNLVYGSMTNSEGQGTKTGSWGEYMQPMIVRYGYHTYNCSNQIEYNAVMKLLDSRLERNSSSIKIVEEDIEKVKKDEKGRIQDFLDRTYPGPKERQMQFYTIDTLTKIFYLTSFKGDHEGDSAYSMFFLHRGDCTAYTMCKMAVLDALGYNTKSVAGGNHEWPLTQINGTWYAHDGWLEPLSEKPFSYQTTETTFNGFQ